MNKILPPKEYLVVGCGGVASYFLPTFLRTLNYLSKKNPPKLTLIDGDILEEKNLERQQFVPKTSRKKVDVLCEMCLFLYNRKIKTRTTYFSQDEILDEGSVVFCFADNHLARRHVLEAIDALHETTPNSGGMAICAANSTISAQAYVYLPEWKGTPLDPRVRFPEIQTDESNSPLKIGDCNSEVVLNDIPQTAIANTMASSSALLLWNLWCNEIPKFGEIEDQDFCRFPVEFFNTSSSLGRVLIKDLEVE